MEQYKESPDYGDFEQENDINQGQSLSNQDKVGELEQKQQKSPVKKNIKNGKSGLGKTFMNQMKQYLVYLNKRIEGTDDFINIQVEVPSSWTIQEFVKYCVEQFNEKLRANGYLFSLSQDITDWAVCEAKKKNGRAKEEPNFANDIPVSDAGVSVFSLLTSQISSQNAFIYEQGYESPELKEQQQQLAQQNQQSKQQQQQSQQNIENNNNNQNQQTQNNKNKSNSKTGSLDIENPKKNVDNMYQQDSLIPQGKQQSQKSKKKQQKDEDMDSGGCFSCFRSSSNKA